MNFNKVIKDIRTEKGLTQKELAEIINTSPQNIAHYEHDRRSCTFDQAVSILKALGFDLLIKDGEIRRNFRMANEYFDKNGDLIEEGMILMHDDGDLSLVYKSDDNDLGFNATNKNYKYNTPGWSIQLYPLSSFCLKEWVIVDETALETHKFENELDYEFYKDLRK